MKPVMDVLSEAKEKKIIRTWAHPSIRSTR